jgi:hypothetical protein
MKGLCTVCQLVSIKDGRRGGGEGGLGDVTLAILQCLALQGAGLEAEAQLCASLAADQGAYWSEENLRDSGFIKTPDVRLQVRNTVRLSYITDVHRLQITSYQLQI